MSYNFKKLSYCKVEIPYSENRMGIDWNIRKRRSIKYADYIEIFGGVAIIILGLQSMIEAVGASIFP